jgi:hypothetical protein
MAQQPNQRINLTTLGASFVCGLGGAVVNGSNSNDISNSTSTAAAIFNNQPLTGITSVNMFIIDKPITYANIDNSSNTKLVSSVIIVGVQPDNYTLNSINISLYFQVLSEYTPTGNGSYLCSYYDTNYLRWDNSACTTPQYNQQFNRYNCSCNHLSTFALVWSPYIPCNTSTQVQLPDGTCVSKSDGQV